MEIERIEVGSPCDGELDAATARSSTSRCRRRCRDYGAFLLDLSG